MIKLKKKASPNVVDVFSYEINSKSALKKETFEEDRKDINRKKLNAIKNFLRNTKADIHFRSFIPHAEKNMILKRMFKTGKQNAGTGNMA